MHLTHSHDPTRATGDESGTLLRKVKVCSSGMDLLKGGGGGGGVRGEVHPLALARGGARGGGCYFS